MIRRYRFVVPRGRVVLQDPCYDLYAPVAELNHARVVRVPLLDDRGDMNAQGLAQAISLARGWWSSTARITPRAMSPLRRCTGKRHGWHPCLAHERRSVRTHGARRQIRIPSLDASDVAGTHDCGRESASSFMPRAGKSAGSRHRPMTSELRKVHQYDVFSLAPPSRQDAEYPQPQSPRAPHHGGAGVRAKARPPLRGLEGTVDLDACRRRVLPGGCIPLIQTRERRRLGPPIDPRTWRCHHPHGRLLAPGTGSPDLFAKRRHSGSSHWFAECDSAEPPQDKRTVPTPEKHRPNQGIEGLGLAGRLGLARP